VIGWYLIRLRSELAPVASARSIEGRLSRLNEVEMTLTVEIGRTRMPIRNVLGLEVGTVVELDRAVGAPADVLLNGRLIAHGEVVVVDQEFAVRITRILDGADTAAR
jgi:flagellar motor switch protein FliN/FliY